MKPVLYFGCIGQAGHYLFGGDDTINKGSIGYVLSNKLDSIGDTPRDEQVQGRVRRFYQLGPEVDDRHCGRVDIGLWSCLDWWDRTVDKRHGSHSVFLARGVFTFSALLEAGRLAWPDVIARQPVPVTP